MKRFRLDYNSNLFAPFTDRAYRIFGTPALVAVITVAVPPPTYICIYNIEYLKLIEMEEVVFNSQIFPKITSSIWGTMLRFFKHLPSKHSGTFECRYRLVSVII